MRNSVLIGIIQRLEAMTHAEGEPEVRRFEMDGVEKCQVTFYPEEESFELKETETGTVFRFDDIDLVAIEVYEMLG